MTEPLEVMPHLWRSKEWQTREIRETRGTRETRESGWWCCWWWWLWFCWSCSYLTSNQSSVPNCSDCWILNDFNISNELQISKDRLLPSFEWKLLNSSIVQFNLQYWIFEYVIILQPPIVLAGFLWSSNFFLFKFWEGLRKCKIETGLVLLAIF